MKLSELSRYWAAKELTQLQRSGNRVAIHAPFSCPDFTVRLKASDKGVPAIQAGGSAVPLKEVRKVLQLEPGTWVREADAITVCFPLPRGTSTLELRL